MVTVETEETPELAQVVLTMGVAAELLVQDGKRQAAALLLDVRRIRIWPSGFHSYVNLYVDHWAVERFSEELIEEIKDAFATVLRDEEEELEAVYVERVLPEP